MNRRKFLKITGATTAPVSISGCAGAFEPDPRPDDPIQFSDLEQPTARLVTGEARSVAGDPLTARVKITFSAWFRTNQVTLGVGEKELGRFEYGETKEFSVELGEGDGYLNRDNILAMSQKNGIVLDYEETYFYDYLEEKNNTNTTQ